LLASAHDHTDGVFLGDGAEPGRHNAFQESLLNKLRRSQKSDVETQQSLVSKLRKDHLVLVSTQNGLGLTLSFETKDTLDWDLANAAFQRAKEDSRKHSAQVREASDKLNELQDVSALAQQHKNKILAQEMETIASDDDEDRAGVKNLNAEMGHDTEEGDCQHEAHLSALYRDD
jgi:hypothetical protein